MRHDVNEVTGRNFDVFAATNVTQVNCSFWSRPTRAGNLPFSEQGHQQRPWQDSRCRVRRRRCDSRAHSRRRDNIADKPADRGIERCRYLAHDQDRRHFSAEFDRGQHADADARSRRKPFQRQLLLLAKRPQDRPIVQPSSRPEHFVLGASCAIAAGAIWAGWLVMMRLGLTTMARGWSSPAP